MGSNTCILTSAGRFSSSLYSSNHASEQAVKLTAATATNNNDLIFIMLNFLEVSLQVEDDTHSIRHVEVICTLAVCST